jgi:hypothetical protein
MFDKVKIKTDEYNDLVKRITVNIMKRFNYRVALNVLCWIFTNF